MNLNEDEFLEEVVGDQSASFTVQHHHAATMPKASRSNSTARQERRHNPLGEDYNPTQPPKQKAGKKRKSVGGAGEDGAAQEV